MVRCPVVIIPVGYSQVNLIFTGTAIPTGAQVTFGVENASGLTPLAIGALVSGNWTSAGMTISHVATCLLSGVLVKNGPNATGPAAQFSVATPGTSPGVTGYAGASTLARKNTASGGRRGRGRMYLPGIAEAEIDPGGALGGGFRTSVQTACTALLAAQIADAIPMVLLHSDATTPTAVTSITVDAIVATQRRRQRR